MRCFFTLTLVALLVWPRHSISEPLESDFLVPAQRTDALTGSRDQQLRGLADRDGDRMSDSLNAMINAAGPGELVEVVVTLSAPQRAANMATRAIGSFRLGREFTIIRGFSASMTAAQATALASTPGIHRIEHDFTYSATLDGATADFGGDDARFDFLVDGSGVTLGRPVGICIIDTGIAADHEQLDGGKVVGFFDAVNGLTVPYDDNGHGTHVASIAAGDGIGAASASVYRGVAPGAALYGAKVLDSAGFGSDSDVIAGIEWCASQPNVDILSLSLASAGASDGQDAGSLAVNCASDPNYSPVCGATTNTPKVVVIGAGNAGPAPLTVGSPGAAENAITVAAVANHSGDGRGVYLSAFSSRGPTLDGRIKPDISAPGMRITAADFAVPTGYTLKSGTSMSTPFVSGVVALMLDANPDLRLVDPVSGRPPVDRIKAILEATAQNRGPDGPAGDAKDPEYGYGLVDAYGAVAEAQGLSPDEYQSTRHPRYQRTEASVAAGGEWLSEPFDVDGDGTPIAATLTIEGVRVCSFGDPVFCELFGSGWEWDPDLDLELVDAASGALVPATGMDITRSECALSGEFCGAGRQETVYYLPLQPGSYRLRVFSLTGAGDFALELSGVNLGLIADAGPDQEWTDNDNDGLEAVALYGGDSSHSDGTIVAYEWIEAGAVIAQGISPIVDFAVGEHTVALTVTDALGNSDSDIVFVDVLANQSPIANAGTDLTIGDHDGSGTEQIALNAGLSDDPGGGTIVSYEWAVGGTSLGAGLSLTLPFAIGSHEIELTVTDNGGATATDSVTVTIVANQPPIANAGPDQTVADHDGDSIELVTIDGTASFDPNGGAISAYSWSQGGSVIGSTAILTAPLAVGQHVITLTVSDAGGFSASDAATVTVLANQTPVANAGADQTLSDFDNDAEESFTLDGGGSSDPGGGTVVSYQWSEDGVVIGNGATLTVTRSVGIHDFTLTVADEAMASDSDTVTVTVDPDPHLAKTILLTRLDGADGATAAVDESGSNHSLTFAGNAQIDTAQSISGGASALFDDQSTSYVWAADSEDWNFGDGEFTVEAWVRFSSLDTYSALVHQFDSASSQNSWLLDWTTNNEIRFVYSLNGTSSNLVSLAAAWTPAVGTWYHVAVDRDSSRNLRVYVDGRVMINAPVSQTFHNSSARLKIGHLHAGWIDDLRITKGAARYQGAFDRPNKPATFDDIVLLSQLDGADGATAAVDESSSNHSLTFAGNAQIDTAQSLSGGASALFDDQSTSYVWAADSEDWNFGDSEFTVEAWVRFSSLDTYSALVHQFDSASSQNSWLLDWTTNNEIRFVYSLNGTSSNLVSLAAAWTPAVGTWYHVAVDRDSSRNLRVYVDGRVMINAPVSQTFHNSSARLKIGHLHAGWIDDLRITKGAAQYAGSFTPPGNVPNFDDVRLLTRLDGADGATNAADESNGAHMLSFVGGTQLDTSQSRFGPASTRFDGQLSSSIEVADSEDWNFGAGEFTVETWLRFASVDTYSSIIHQYDGPNSQISWLLDWTPDQQIRFLYSTDGSTANRGALAAEWTPETGRWYHVAMDRDPAKMLRVYVDGTVLIEALLPVNFHDSTANLRMGTLHDGWIDEVRITKGVAWYGGPFTPPDQPFPGAVEMLVAEIEMAVADR